MTYNAVVVGAGGRAVDHIVAYSHLPEGAATAVCSRSLTRAAAVAKRFGIRAYDDARSMILTEKPDIVHITTPPTDRVEIMSLVASLGIPLCTIEKPIAVGVSDWRALVDLEASSATRFAVCHQFRWQPKFARCVESVVSGKCGALKMLDLSAGRNLGCQGTHILNYGRALNDDQRISRVFGSVSGWTGKDSMHPAPDASEAHLTFENGVRGIWVTGPSAPQTGDPTTDWQHVRVAAFCEQGLAGYEEFGRWEIVSCRGVETGDYGGMQQWRTDNDAAQAAFHRAMFDWANNALSAPGTNLADSLHEWQVVLALYQSAVLRQPVDLADFEPAEDLIDRLKEAL